MASVPRTSTSREQFLDGAARLFRRQGYNGTGLKEITAASAAPWGSLYHHFPGGKSQLGAEAIERSGAGYLRLMAKVFDEADDPIDAMVRFFALAADALEASDFGDGCPIATAALDTASSNDEVRRACASVFTAWLDALAARLVPVVGPERARTVAVLGLSALEGSIILSRTLRTTEPLNVAARELEAAARATATRRPRRPKV